MSATDTWPSSIPADWRPDPLDERLHTPFGDPDLPWKETFFFSLRDEGLNANIQMHMTVSANRSPNTRCQIQVSQGNRSPIQMCREDGDNSDAGVGNSMSRLEFVNLSWDSDHELRWVGDLDDVAFDLKVKGQHFAPLWDTMHKGFYAVGAEGHDDGQVYCHTEQVIVAEGTLTWKDDGTPLPFKGFGWRDRGWGRRKTQRMWPSGWDLVAAVLPDESVFSFISLRSHEFAASAPQPIGGWYSDAETLTPLVGGFYRKTAYACPHSYELHFENGKVIEGELVKPTGRVACAMQEAEHGPEAPNWAATMQDYYSIFKDPTGSEFSLFSQNGYIHPVDVFRDAQFIHAGNPPQRGAV